MIMLVLSRKLGEKLQIGSDITFTVLQVKADRVRIGIAAPAEVPIIRHELCGARDKNPVRKKLQWDGT
jgi:carbon storage regulator